VEDVHVKQLRRNMAQWAHRKGEQGCPSRLSHQKPRRENRRVAREAREEAGSGIPR